MKVVCLDDANLSYKDAGIHFNEAASWAIEHCVSFVGHEIFDVSELSCVSDMIAEYTFDDPKDASWFLLRWS